MGELSFELNGDNGKELMVSYSDEGYGYGPPILEDDDYVQHLSRIVDFRKIQPVKFDDPEIGRIQFSSWKAFFSFDDVEEARFEGDYSVAYLLYKYHKKYKEIPKLLRFGNEVISGKFYDKFYHYMADHHAEAFDFSHTYDNKDMELQNFAVAMDRMLIYFDGHSSYLLYPDSYLENKESPLYTLLGVIKKYKLPRVFKNKIYVVFKTQHGFQKKPFDVKKRTTDLEMNYNEGFSEVSSEIITKLNNKKKTGLVILHGEPGTGKTTYIRYLAGKLKRSIIFISPDMVHHITSPEFIPFLMDNSDSILIIEDAEPALQKRIGDGRTGAVSNILNMTDGLLSDCLNISIVATFNTTTKDIDEALLRQGRLLKAYKFDKLEVEKAQYLMDCIGKGDVQVREPMSLAEIYFHGDDVNSDEFERKSAGFDLSQSRKKPAGFGRS